ncbi:MAG: hypothetical protein DMG21_08070 [Acidobacteria bacterium]|nr:MAG: hypothetical protein DMG21_08070 [Acidobacteriota bacterium]
MAGSGADLNDKIVILVACGSRREAKKIARRLVESKLAACVNVSPPFESIYRWKGKIRDDREVLILIKTRRQLFPIVEATSRRLRGVYALAGRINRAASRRSRAEIVLFETIGASPSLARGRRSSLRRLRSRRRCAPSRP